MHPTIQKLKDKLDKYPNIKYQFEDNSLTVSSTEETTFPVSLHVNRHVFTVSFKSWHEDFKHEKEALNCFMLGLTNLCRLKVLSRGKFEYKWILEYKEGAHWLQDSETGLLFFPFWIKKKSKYLKNSYLNEK